MSCIEKVRNAININIYIDEKQTSPLLNYWIIQASTENYFVNPLRPHDALKHHFTSLKIHLIFLQSRVLERKFP